MLTASELAYTALRVAGAAYMVWLGLRLLMSAATRGRDAAHLTAVTSSSDMRLDGLWRGWRRSFLTSFLNPKMGAFYVAVLPQFLPTGVNPLGMGLLLAFVHDILGIAWFAVLILAAGPMRRALRGPAAQRAVDATTGSVRVGFGVRLGLTTR